MYYSNGNYEAFARPLKPEGGDEKSAYFKFFIIHNAVQVCQIFNDYHY